jgi:hypothetical protein
MLDGRGHRQALLPPGRPYVWLLPENDDVLPPSTAPAAEVSGQGGRRGPAGTEDAAPDPRQRVRRPRPSGPAEPFPPARRPQSKILYGGLRAP